MNRIIKRMLYAIGSIALTSCASGKLVTSAVTYQSVRTTFHQPTEIPDDAEIAVVYTISDGDITPIIKNRTSEIMIIDQTLSFFVNTNGQSTSYYDPTVRTTTQTDLSSQTKGASVNLGSLAGAFGIGGTAGRILGGINVGGSGTSGTSISNTTYFADQPRTALAPKSQGAMPKVFHIAGVGSESLNNASGVAVDIKPSEALKKFSVCISYSTDNGNSFKKLVTDFFVNSQIVIPVERKGMVNDALRELYAAKPDALSEDCWLLHFKSNLSGHTGWGISTLVDYQ